MAVSKERRKRRRRKSHILLKILLFIGCAVGLYYFMTSDYFCVTRVDIEGNQHYTKEEVLAISGDPRGQNVFDADLAGMQERLAGDAYVESAVVERELVSGIRITVEERTPFVAVAGQNPEGAPFWAILDDSEHWIETVLAEPEIPIVSGVLIQKNDNHVVKLNEKQLLFRETLELIRRTSSAGMYFKKTDIQETTIVLYIYDQLTCSGTPENIMNGFDALKEVLIDLTNKGIREGEIRISGESTASYTPPAPTEEPVPEQENVVPEGKKDAEEGEKPAEQPGE